MTDPLLIEFLSRNDAPCPRCGYSLRNLTADRCPECGDRLRLQVGLVEPRLGAFIASLIACGLGLGGSGLILTIVVSIDGPGGLAEKVADVVRDLFGLPTLGFGSREGFWVLLLLVEFAVAGAGLGALLKWPAAFRRWAPEHQWAAAAALWVFLAVMSGALVANIR
jgi:hypothetical protein